MDVYPHFVQTMHIDWFGELNIYIGMGIKVVTAIFLGGLIGLDRERKLKAAGIKTNVLICLGACLYTSVSLLNQYPGSPFDPNRVAAQVVSGIGFLGAGAIIHGKGQVIGLTTAATIWVVAAVGVTIGSGHPFIATIFTVTILAVLNVLGPLYYLFQLKKTYHIEVLSSGSVKKSIRQVVQTKADTILEINEEQVGQSDDILLHLYVLMNPKVLNDLVTELEDIIRVKKVHAHQADKDHDLHNTKQAA